MTLREDTQPVILRITAPRAPVPLHKPVRLAVDYFALGDSQRQNITVDWGDGTLDRIIRTRCGRARDSRRFKEPGAYAITVTGTGAAGANTKEFVMCVVGHCRATNTDSALQTPPCPKSSPIGPRRPPAKRSSGSSAVAGPLGAPASLPGTGAGQSSGNNAGAASKAKLPTVPERTTDEKWRAALMTPSQVGSGEPLWAKGRRGRRGRLPQGRTIACAGFARQRWPSGKESYSYETKSDARQTITGADRF